MQSLKLMQALGKTETVEGVENSAGHVEDEDFLIIPADRSISEYADRVTEMFQITPAVCGISGAVNLFQHQFETIK